MTKNLKCITVLVNSNKPSACLHACAVLQDHFVNDKSVWLKIVIKGAEPKENVLEILRNGFERLQILQTIFEDEPLPRHYNYVFSD